MKMTSDFSAQSNSRSMQKGKKAKGFSLINPNAAGIDIGADSHWVSVPSEQPNWQRTTPYE